MEQGALDCDDEGDLIWVKFPDQEARAIPLDYFRRLMVENEIKELRDRLRAAEQERETYAIELGHARPYLKDDETVAECIARNRKDTDVVLGQLVAATKRAEAAERKSSPEYIREWLTDTKRFDGSALFDGITVSCVIAALCGEGK